MLELKKKKKKIFDHKKKFVEIIMFKNVVMLKKIQFTICLGTHNIQKLNYKCTQFVMVLLR